MNDDAPARAGSAAAAASDFERFQIRDRLEIVGIIRTLVERRALVTLVYGGGQFFVSALLRVAPGRDEIIIDGASDESVHAAVLASPRLTLATTLEHIRIQFHATGATGTTFEGHRALRVAIPASVMRLQRREYYRMRIPPGESLICELRGAPPAADNPLPLAVHDIGCGGVALVDWPEGRAPQSHVVYRGCRLLLPEDEPLCADLEVVYVLERTEADGTRVRRCGARFVDLPGKLVTRVQRYITRLERQQKAQREARDDEG